MLLRPTASLIACFRPHSLSILSLYPVLAGFLLHSDSILILCPVASIVPVPQVRAADEVPEGVFPTVHIVAEERFYNDEYQPFMVHTGEGEESQH